MISGEVHTGKYMIRQVSGQVHIRYFLSVNNRVQCTWAGKLEKQVIV